MSIYSSVDTGTKVFRSRFHKSISYSKKYDAQFGQIIPVLNKFVLPGDVWRIGGECLVRFQPMLAPSLTPCMMKVRYFFIPLRLLEDNTELILTGSKDGHLYSGTLPEFKNAFADADKLYNVNAYVVAKHSLLDYYGCQTGDYESFKNDSCLPAQYWLKAYYRVFYDYYDDENIGYMHQQTDFDAYWNSARKAPGQIGPLYTALPKDYFTSALPWQLKGTAPVLNVTGNASFQFTPNFDLDSSKVIGDAGSNPLAQLGADYSSGGNQPPFLVQNYSQSNADNFTDNLNYMLNQSQSVTGATIQGLGFNADELRTMMAQTRIFERLARTGSRYTEYLRANFGTAPADDTLQRAQYLGGWKLPIVTTEVLQTAAADSKPVGTMRGHGITRGGNRINTFFAKEFGIIIGLAHVIPKIEYTQGCPREMSYKTRFDFFNPSFQHLSEQEIRNGELFLGTDNKNDDTFGFQAYGNELRTSQDQTVGDLRDSLAYWTQSINFGTTRPNLNNAFINSKSYHSNFNQAFAVNGAEAYPIIVQFYNDLDVYRPMIKYSTPGLVDHL